MTTLNPFWTSLPGAPYGAAAAVLALNSGADLVPALEPLACAVREAGDPEEGASLMRVIDSFQMAGGRGRITEENAAPVRKNLADFIGGIDPARFAGLMRFMETGPSESEGVRRIAPREDRGILPEIVADGPLAHVANAGRLAASKMFDLMFNLSLKRDSGGGVFDRLNEVIDFSGLLDCRRVHFTFAPKLLDQVIPCIVSVYNPSLGFDEPCIRVHAGRKRIEPSMLLLAVLHAYERARANPSSAACLSSLWMREIADALRAPLEWEYGIVRRAQEILLSHDPDSIWDGALGETGINRETRDQLRANLKNTSIKISLRDPILSGDESRGVSFSYREAQPSRPEGDRRRFPVLAINFILPRRDEKPAVASIDRLMDYVRRAALMWVMDGMPSKTKTEPLLEGVANAVIHRDREPIILAPGRVSKKWAAGMKDILDWMWALKRGNTRDGRFPGLKDAAEFLDPKGMPDVLSGIPPISSLAIGGGIFHSVTVVANGGQDYHARFVLDIASLQSKNPFDLIDAAERAAIRGLPRFNRTAGDSRRFPPEEISRINDRPWAQMLAWLKLMWKYEQLLKKEAPSGGGLNFSGFAAKMLGAKIARAVASLSLSDPGLAQKSAAERGEWILDIAGRGVEPSAQNSPWRADRVTVLSLPRARLIHFNGEPRFSEGAWKKIAKVILSSPEGVTWIDVRRGWESNRSELLWEEGEERWYEQNRHYSRAAPLDKKTYRDALKLARGYAANYQRLKKPAPTPRSTALEIRHLRFAMTSLFHTDKKDAEVIDRTKFRRLMDAMDVLAKFHKGME